MQKNSAKLHLPSLLKKTPFLLILFGLSISPVFGACHTVSPTGSGAKTGADWNNALAGLPSTLTRGDIYYLADGSYGSYSFNTAASSTTTVEIRKAQSYDNCTSTGWNTSTMGSAQADFSGSPGFSISSSYLILNGNGQQTAAGCGSAPGSTVSAAPPTPTDCGIKVTDTANEGVALDSSNVTLEYVELLGSGTNNDSSLAEVFGNTPAGPSTFTHLYGHNAGCVYFQYAGSNRTVSHSYFWGTEVEGNASACHGQYSFDISMSNGVEHANVYRDITGTAAFTYASFSGQQGVVNNMQIYDNVFYNSSPASSWSPFFSDGTISCIANSGTGETEQCSNITMSQNTFINLSSNSGVNNDCTDGCGAGSSYIIQNNLWYTGAMPVFTTAAPATYTQSYNSCLGGSCPSDTNNVSVPSSPPNPFVNWTAGNFALASDAANWNNRLALSSPYTTDAGGNTFTTDRGAHQFGSGGVGAPVSLSGSATPQ